MDNTFQDNQGDDQQQPATGGGQQFHDNSGQSGTGGGQQFQDDSGQSGTGGGQQSHDDQQQPVQPIVVPEVAPIVPAPVEPVFTPEVIPASPTPVAPVPAVPVVEDKKKEDLPEISEEEVKNFNMNSFDPSLKPDLSKLSDDSLGKALGSKGAQYGDGAQMTAQQQYEDIVNTPMPASNLQFDGKNFLELLAGSISLMYTEKKAIIGQIPKLSQFQIDELLKILTEEKKKFAQLNKKHQTELKKIEDKHANPEEKQKLREEETAQKSKDELEAEELLKKLQGF